MSYDCERMTPLFISRLCFERILGPYLLFLSFLSITQMLFFNSTVHCLVGVWWFVPILIRVILNVDRFCWPASLASTLSFHNPIRYIFLWDSVKDSVYITHVPYHTTLQQRISTFMVSIALVMLDCMDIN